MVKLTSPISGIPTDSDAEHNAAIKLAQERDEIVSKYDKAHTAASFFNRANELPTYDSVEEKKLKQRARVLSPDVRQIDLDVNRTYRDHIMFRDRYDVKQQALFHVLTTYSMYNTVVLEMLFTGAPIPAQDALLHGLVSKVVPEEKLEEETLSIAQKICDTSRPVVSLGKAMFYGQMAQGRNTAYRMASQAMVDNLALKDGQEGIKSFIEKRQPVWTHTTDKAHK
ncbi:UNVERIFIED_CONTAM: hypothetical protein FKN15_051064 [Acipenser sinensis]